MPASQGIRLEARAETFRVDGEFVIARGARTATEVVTVTLQRDVSGKTARGWGESVPYPHYGESIEGVLREVLSLGDAVRGGLSREALQGLLPAGAARAALDAALWHLEADVARLEGVPTDRRRTSKAVEVATVRTISLDSPEVMAREARRWAPRFASLKLKLDGTSDRERVTAVRGAAPGATLLVDANEAWRPDDVEELSHQLASCGVVAIEQPLPPGSDEALSTFEHPVPIVADESFHTVDDLPRVRDRYDGVNLKLEKTGGLTHAFAALEAARAHDLQVMVGCMLCTSLGIAPALHLAPHADWVDVDAPYLLAEDRVERVVLGGGTVGPNPALWPDTLPL